jgi:hypothetical protein
MGICRNAAGEADIPPFRIATTVPEIACRMRVPSLDKYDN